MKQSSLPLRRPRKPLRREFFFISLAALGLTACNPPKVKDERVRNTMGQRVPVGPLTFNVLETKWESSLGTMPNARMPQRQFLLVRLSITNGGGERQGFPILSIVNAQGERFREEEDPKHVPEPLGLIRIIAPGETVFGWVLYDVPQTDYLMELTDGNLDNEHTALVELPFRLN